MRRPRAPYVIAREQPFYLDANGVKHKRATKPRRCLQCEALFDSHGPQHRLCDVCRDCRAEVLSGADVL